MNKSYRKLVLRGIRKSITRFLSILGIVALGVGFLCGLLATMPDMKKSADAFYDGANTYDIQIQGTMGITKKDIAYLKDLNYIQQVEGVYTVDLLMRKSEEESYTTRLLVRDFDDKGVINGTELLSGRYPTSADECVIAVVNPYTSTHELGEVLILDKKNEDYKHLRKKLKYNKFKVVGTVRSPSYISSHG